MSNFSSEPQHSCTQKSESLEARVQSLETLVIKILVSNLELEAKVQSLQTGMQSMIAEMQRVKEDLTYLKSEHDKEGNSEDKRSGWDHAPDTFSDDCCSKADSYEQEQAAERLGGR